MAKQSFGTQLAKGFVRSAVNQMGREAGRTISNRAYNNQNYVNVRDAASPISGDYTHIGENNKLEPPITFGAAKWFWFSVLSLFTYGLSNIGYAIYGLNLRNRTWAKITETKTDVVRIPDRRCNLGYRTELKEYGIKKTVAAPEYFRDIYRKAGNTILTASIIAFISAIIFLITVLAVAKNDVPNAFAIVPLIYFGILIGLPIWGHHAIQKAFAEVIAQLEKLEAELIEAQKLAEKAELEAEQKRLIESMPLIPTYPVDAHDIEFRGDMSNIVDKASHFGGFAGYIIPEPDNPYDTNAMAIYANGEKYGYLTKKDSARYANWREGHPALCVGCMTSNGGKLTGVVKAFRFTTKKALYESVNKFFNWFRENGQEHLIPDDPHFLAKINTKEGVEEII